jgi:hypothetical protein
LSVATTNNTATATVTAWEKMSQVLRMGRLGMAARSALATCLDSLFDVGQFRDYGLNDLRLEARHVGRRNVSGVTPSRALNRSGNLVVSADATMRR